jgi:hypothetical protein
VPEPISNAYLSGWEYNRLLQANPARSRNTALPAAVFWNGAHQFWLFDKVYVTKESLDNEYAAYERLGWASGKILKDLEAEGIVEAVDWQQLPGEVGRQLNARHAQLRESYSEQLIRDLISARDGATLETLKENLIEPVMRHYNCVGSGQPNSVGNWEPDDLRQHAVDTAVEVQRHLAHLAEPLLPGFPLCQPPGTGLGPEVMYEQTRVQDTIERPLISDLLAGDGDFQGPEGYLAYFDALIASRSAYEPVNKQLTKNWDDQRKNLDEIRKIARRKLWPVLHEEWIPRLLVDDEFGGKLPGIIRTARWLSPIADKLSNKPSRILLGSLAAIIAQQSFTYLSHHGVPGEAAAAGTAAASAMMATQAWQHLTDAGRLAVFYQAAKRHA